jgi:ATP-binding cassette subfamily B protein
VKPLKFNHHIKLEDVSFSYKGSKVGIFSGINLTIEKGDCIGLIGDSGCGKSTILDILMGLLLPTQGRLIVDGKKIDSNNIIQWRSNISHVPQSVFMTDDSIENNITFFNQKVIDSSLISKAIEDSQLDYFIDKLPNGLKTTVGEMGDKISGGQKQRIGLARAMYKNSDIYILDESTSALDNETEQSVMQAIEGLGEDITIFMIAHRLTTLKKCTQIIEVTEGGIKKKGTYQQFVGSTS